MVIRDEVESDIQVIGEITKTAFATPAISRHTEQFIIEEPPRGVVVFHNAFTAQA